MAYVDGFVTAVSSANKEVYRTYALEAAGLFKAEGALAVCECWEDDVPEGKVTSMPMAVKRKEGEAIAFSWTIWPSKEVRNTAWERLMTNPRFDPKTNPMPFDGVRMIYGGFEQFIAE